MGRGKPRPRAGRSTDPAAGAAQRTLGVLDRIPAARLRSTARARLVRLTTALTDTPAAGVTDLHDRTRALAPLIDAHGNAST